MLFSLHKQLFSYNWQQCCVNNMSQIPSKMQDQNKLAGKCFRVIPGLGKCLAPISNKILNATPLRLRLEQRLIFWDGEGVERVWAMRKMNDALTLNFQIPHL